MHTLPRLLALTLLGATAATSAWPCGAPDTAVFQDQNLQDLTWVRASNPVFVSYSQGPTFHLQFSPYSETMVGDRAGQQTAVVAISPDKRWLLYRLGGVPDRLYDIRTRQVHRVDMPLDWSSTLAFSPDSHFLAATARDGANHGISVLDLSTFSTQTYFPADEMKPQGPAGIISWSRDGRDVLNTYGNRSNEQAALALDPVSGAFRMIESRQENTKSIDRKTRFFENGQEIGMACPICMLIPPTEIALAGGFKVVHQDYRIEVIKAGEPNRLLAETPKPPPRKPDEPVLGCAGPGFHLLGTLDDRYVLYRADGLAWIYGLTENRKALLTKNSVPVSIHW